MPSRLPTSKFSRLLPKKCESPFSTKISLLSNHGLHDRSAFKQHNLRQRRPTSNVSFSSQGFQGIPSAYKVHKDHRPRNNHKSRKVISPYAINTFDDENNSEEHDNISKKYATGKKLKKPSGTQRQHDIEQGADFVAHDDSSSAWSFADQEDALRSKGASFRKYTGKSSLTRGAMKNIQRLANLQNEMEHLMKSYGEQMGIDVMDIVDENTLKSLEGSRAIRLQEDLLETEETYRKICIHLRQLIAGWSWMKPFPRSYAEQWQSDQEGNSLPPANAAKFLQILEHIRKQREDLIYVCIQEQEKKINHLRDNKSEKSTTKLVKWLKDKISMTNEDNRPLEHDTSQSSTQMKLKDLVAHKSIDFTANVRLYDVVLHCFCQWRQISTTFEGNSIESIFSAMTDNYQGGNPNVRPGIKVYHRMIQFYKDSETLVHAMKGVELLKEMIKSSEKDANKDPDFAESSHGLNIESCEPTIATFTLVISAFHGIGSTTEVKVQALDAADEVLHIMEQFYSTSGALNSNVSSIEPSPVSGSLNLPKKGNKSKLEFCEPYRMMLQNLIAVGPKLLSDYKFRVDDIMERLIGKQSYEKLILDDDSLIDRTIIDHLVLHDLIHALAITNETNHINKAKVILKKMEATRDAASAPSAATRISLNPWPSNYPTPNSYKSIILGILHSSIDVDDESSVRKVVTIEDAVYATDLLDIILKTKPSMRNVYSCYRVIRLWGATNSEDAGRKGEEILGKMIMAILINKDPHLVTDLLLRAKQSTLENWSVAAAAGAPNAASNAFNLMERIRERLFEANTSEERRRKEMSYFYIAVIRACAETVLDHEKEQALDIAFETYNKMIEDRVTLSPFLFVQLMKCCQLASSSSHGKAIMLSKEVFQAACMNGLVNRHVLFVLKQVNYHLFESYEKKPEHSANVKKISHLDD
jgi:hypothetical protein